MNFKLINQPNLKLPAMQQVLLNRGIAYVDIERYINSTDDDINNPEAFGSETMLLGAKMLMRTISRNNKCMIVVDCDCDGFTSAAILINYLHDIFPTWVETNLRWYLHKNKQHGLSDCYKDFENYQLVICPDSSSNDYDYHEYLHNLAIDVLVLDHHEAEKISTNAWIINNQLSDYPNKNLSGAGVAWQFCRYIDKLMNTKYADKYRDLCALGNLADMMSMRSIETKHIIMTGIQQIQNPFFQGMVEKNAYSIGDKVTPFGVAFYVAPFVNAIVRSGTIEEKELIFESMLEFKAYNKIPSTKRGHKLGEEESVLAQALRTATNVKNRQTRAQDAGLELLEGLIESRNLLDHKVLLFLLEPGQIDRNIAGLVANKFAPKYQRPCCILTKVIETNEDIPPWEDCQETVSYQGSARGYERSGITNFKDICSNAPGVMYAEGHQNAFGLGIEFSSSNNEEVAGESILQFIDYTDNALKNMSSKPVYYIDYLYQGDNIDSDNILSIAHLNDLWGKDMDEALVGVEDLKITSKMVTVYRKKGNTLKITLPSGMVLMKFNATDEECDIFTSDDFNLSMDLVGTCNENEWRGCITPQIFIQDYELIKIPHAQLSALDF